MANCECGPDGYDCEVGKQLAFEMFRCQQLLEGKMFAARPAKQREEIQRQYNAVVEAYAQHCSANRGHVEPSSDDRCGSYASEVMRTYAGGNTLKEQLTLGALGLAGESGEIVEIIKKWSFSGHELDPTHLLEEMGDVLWYLQLMCSGFGWTLGDAMEMNVQKLRKRYPDGFSPERSIHRSN